MRPFSKYEFKAIYKHILPMVLKKAGRVLQESYNATVFNCGNQCLRFSVTPVSSGFLEKGSRKSWFWFAYDVEFYTLHPLDFQFLVDMSAVDPAHWEVQRVFYANKLFKSLEEFLDMYDKNTINKTRITFPIQPLKDQYSAVYMRGDPVPQTTKPPPQQIQPSGPRYTIEGNLVNYMDWRFNLHISPSVGPQLFDIRYKGERIVYELSMQEIGVLYSGHSPAASMLYFADSAGLFGTRMRGMMPGIDCPEHGSMLDAIVYTSNELGLKTLPNSLCIFEHNPETPLRRHRAYGMSGAFYSALIDHVLVVRMYICIINYDYVFDFVFHNNGAIEVKVSSTGYLASSFHFPEEELYGTRISDNVVAGLHHHLFQFKADIDIKGTSNRYQTWNIGKEAKRDKWADNPSQFHTQNVMVKEDKKTEKEAVYMFDFNHPKHLLFYSNRSSVLGNNPAYRLIHKGLTKTLLPEGDGFEPSMSWGRHQMFVTRHKDDEMTSSSMFAMWDAADPVVNFKTFWDDDESIMDQDIVAWITLGNYHIPQMENVPNTATVGTTQSFFLVPFNYFKEDPSLASRDSVKIMPRDPQRPFEGAVVDRHNMTQFYNCHSQLIDRSLFSNSTFLFS
ncbi:unnamed protein product [Candidula unifasciata]|uniref:Amine oxidase n=1 Tax=Candidula unifasciata TaxID=100452 RepID=A0A8S3ZDE7_9EUPU|nr:unnamed protein product [Candidula unifasciata]